MEVQPAPDSDIVTIPEVFTKEPQSSRLYRRDLKKMAQFVTPEFLGTLDMLRSAQDETGACLSRQEAALTYLASSAAREIILTPAEYSHLILEMEDGRETGELAAARSLAEDILCAVLIRK